MSAAYRVLAVPTFPPHSLILEEVQIGMLQTMYQHLLVFLGQEKSNYISDAHGSPLTHTALPLKVSKKGMLIKHSLIPSPWPARFSCVALSLWSLCSQGAVTAVGWCRTCSQLSFQMSLPTHTGVVQRPEELMWGSERSRKLSLPSGAAFGPQHKC